MDISLDIAILVFAAVAVVVAYAVFKRALRSSASAKRSAAVPQVLRSRIEGLARSLGAETPNDDQDPLRDVNVYIAYEKFGEAETALRTALESHPDRFHLRLKLAEVLALAGRQREAEAELDSLEAIRLSRNA